MENVLNQSMKQVFFPDHEELFTERVVHHRADFFFKVEAKMKRIQKIEHLFPLPSTFVEYALGK